VASKVSDGNPGAGTKQLINQLSMLGVTVKSSQRAVEIQKE
jgi:hypothetical protein